MPRKPAQPLLGAAGGRLYTAVLGRYDLEAHEVELLISACRLADTIAALEELLARDGLVVEGSKKQPRLSTAVTELRQSRLSLARLMGDLALPADGEIALPSPVSQRASRAAQSRHDRARRLEGRRGA